LTRPGEQSVFQCKVTGDIMHQFDVRFNGFRVRIAGFLRAFILMDRQLQRRFREDEDKDVDRGEFI